MSEVRAWKCMLLSVDFLLWTVVYSFGEALASVSSSWMPFLITRHTLILISTDLCFLPYHCSTAPLLSSVSTSWVSYLKTCWSWFANGVCVRGRGCSLPLSEGTSTLKRLFAEDMNACIFYVQMYAASTPATCQWLCVHGYMSMATYKWLCLTGCVLMAMCQRLHINGFCVHGYVPMATCQRLCVIGYVPMAVYQWLCVYG
jgi:hypothetical protein